MKRITYLRTVYGMLHGELPGRPHAVILDEGPVYMLARLRVYGGERLRSAAFERWWREALAQWARTVDLIVWLDAPDQILMQRSRTRTQVHQLQRLPEARAQQFLAAYREAYETVVGALTEFSGPAVLRVRSDQEGVEAIRDRVFARLRLLQASGQT
jgi:thymidylate kinase